MSVLPLRWQGATRIDGLRVLVEQRVDEWLSHWFVAGKVPGAAVELIGGPRVEAVSADARWYAIREGDAVLHVRLGASTIEHLGCRLVGIAVADDAGLAAGIGLRAVTALARSLFGNAVAGSLEPLNGTPGATEVGVRHGAVAMQIAIGTLRFDLHASAALCARLMPAKTGQCSPLVPRRDAIGPVDATLDAMLDLGQVSLAESLSLKPGEVLKTTIPVGAGLRLVSAHGEEILAGTLVADGAYRALKLTHTYFQKGKSR
jgi:hypothetical protein